MHEKREQSSVGFEFERGHECGELVVTRKHRCGHGMLEEEDKSEHLVIRGEKAKLISQQDYANSSRRNQNQPPENNSSSGP